MYVFCWFFFFVTILETPLVMLVALYSHCFGCVPEGAERQAEGDSVGWWLYIHIVLVVFQEELSSEQKETALRVMPSLLEVAGHTYFFGGFLVGPQVSYYL